MKNILSGPSSHVYDVSGIITFQRPGDIMRSERVHESVESISPIFAQEAVLNTYPNAEFSSIPIINDVTDDVLAFRRCALLPCVNAASLILNNDQYNFGCCSVCARKMSDMNSDNAKWIDQARRNQEAKA